MIGCDGGWTGRDSRCTGCDGSRTATGVTGRAAGADRTTTRNQRTRHPIRISSKDTGWATRRKRVMMNRGEIHTRCEWRWRERRITGRGRVW